MKYKMILFLYAGSTVLALQPRFSEKVFFRCSIQFPQAMSYVKPVRIFYNGQRLISDLDDASKKVSCILGAEKNKKIFYLLITSEKIKPVKARLIAPDVKQNTIAYFKLNRKQNYKFYKITLTQEAKMANALDSSKKNKKSVRKWRVEEVWLARETGRIPDDAIIVALNADWIEKIEGGSDVEFPRIIIKKSILKSSGSEKILHEEMTQALLASLDLDTLHTNVRQEKRGDPTFQNSYGNDNVTYMIILGIETSCDETAAAVYNTTRGILSNELFSQIELHKKFGGVVPEIASRSHLEKINIIVNQALTKAGIAIEDVDVIAVTNKPGLPGSLLIGLCFAKAIAWAKDKKIIGINHLEGHAFSTFLEYNVPFPHICLTASGGHTSLYMIHGFGDYEVLGQTTDDAAGEAFDKIAKIMGLPYPGGPVIEQLAREVNFKDFRAYPRQNPKIFDFSFSGLKTAVLYDLVKHNAFDMSTKKLLPAATEVLKKEVASSLLVCIADGFEQKLALAVEKFPHIKAVSFVGGVACNKYIKQRLLVFSQRHGLEFFSPSAQYCTDNAAMIAFVGAYKAEQGKFSDLALDILE